MSENIRKIGNCCAELLPQNWRELVAYMLLSAIISIAIHWINGEPIVIGLLPLPRGGQGDKGETGDTGPASSAN